VYDNSHGHPELVTKRNDPLINPHNRLMLQGWRANVDLKPIISIHAALQYISKYASKAESRSAAFSEILDQILNNSKPDDPILTSYYFIMLQSWIFQLKRLAIYSLVFHYIIQAGHLCF